MAAGSPGSLQHPSVYLSAGNCAGLPEELEKMGTSLEEHSEARRRLLEKAGPSGTRRWRSTQEGAKIQRYLFTMGQRLEKWKEDTRLGFREQVD